MVCVEKVVSCYMRTYWYVLCPLPALNKTEKSKFLDITPDKQLLKCIYYCKPTFNRVPENEQGSQEPHCHEYFPQWPVFAIYICITYKKSGMG